MSTAPGTGSEARPSYGFLRTRRWLGIMAIGVVVALTCAALGRWQWTRHADRLEAVHRIEANYDSPAVRLAEVLPGPGSALSDDAEWRPVTAVGTYADGGEVVLRTRPVAGTPAVHVLAPLVVTTADGERAVLVVDRGWLPAGAEETADGVPDAPTGEVTVLARLRPAERPTDRVGPPGQVYSIDPETVLAASGAPDDVTALPVLDAYGALVSEDPRPELAPAPLPTPNTDLGSHLSYAFQWWVFAVGALVGVAVLARREAATLRAQEGPPSSATAPRRRRASAEDEEDALIDAQLDPKGAPRVG